MKKITVYAAALALTLTGAAGAQAEDWRSGLYIKGAAGWNHTMDQDYTGGETEFDEGYAISGAVGYDYGDWRSELEITYRNDDVDSHKNAAGASLANSGGDIDSTAFMVNGYYDIPTGMRFQPYVGAGIGLAHVGVNDYSVGGVSFADETDNVFAYQGIVGAEYQFADNVDFFTEYKYFATEDIDTGGNTEGDYKNHAIMVGLKYDMN